ncbi:MAG: hypothetical protein PF692_08920 [Kiritimatiellae bacterium]|nr:hypothetical protein [Kiritimatiellia bacterium]
MRRCFADRLEPVGRILDSSVEECVVWSCSPIYDSDGKVHLFFTRVPGSVDEWFKNLD